MTDDSPPLVPKILINEKKNSSWNFDELDDEENELNTSEDFFSVLKKNLNQDKKKSSLSNQQSTVKIDSSDLIKRCQQFLPLLTDANKNLFTKIQSGENVKIELDSDDDNDHEQTIEMNLMFCPDMDSSSDSDNEQINSTSIQIKRKNNNSVNIIEIKSEENINK